MKKTYEKPRARKIDYCFDEQITAASYLMNDWHDPYWTGKCTWGNGVCNIIFNVPTSRGVDNCANQGVIG